VFADVYRRPPSEIRRGAGRTIIHVIGNAAGAIARPF
jgi:hypothetical protein